MVLFRHPIGSFRFYLLNVSKEPSQSFLPRFVKFSSELTLRNKKGFIKKAALCSGIAVYTLYSYHKGTAMKCKKTVTHSSDDARSTNQ